MATGKLGDIIARAKQLRMFSYDLVDTGGEERRGPYSSQSKWHNLKSRADALVTALESQAPVTTPRYKGCNVPPAGWWCSREPNHEGPCAARPLSDLDSAVDPIDVNETAENLGETRRDLQP